MQEKLLEWKDSAIEVSKFDQNRFARLVRVFFGYPPDPLALAARPPLAILKTIIIAVGAKPEYTQAIVRLFLKDYESASPGNALRVLKDSMASTVAQSIEGVPQALAELEGFSDSVVPLGLEESCHGEAAISHVISAIIKILRDGLIPMLRPSKSPTTCTCTCCRTSSRIPGCCFSSTSCWRLRFSSAWFTKTSLTLLRLGVASQSDVRHPLVRP